LRRRFIPIGVGAAELDALIVQRLQAGGREAAAGDHAAAGAAYLRAAKEFPRTGAPRKRA